MKIELELRSSTAVVLPVLLKNTTGYNNQAAAGRYPNKILGPSHMTCAELSIHWEMIGFEIQLADHHHLQQC